MSAATSAAVPGACSRLAAPEPFEVWRVDLSVEPSDRAQRMLDADEQARVTRFAFERLRRRHRAAHVALRSLLARHVGDEPAMLRFDRGPHGKPRLAGRADAPAFNLSDSDDVALIAIAPGGSEIGVDVERLRSLSDALELAALHFCEREVAWLAAAADRDRAFLRVWVAKEACLKAIGSGLSLSAASFDGGLVGMAAVAPVEDGAAWRRVTVPTPAGPVAVELAELDAGADCVAALARCVSA